MANQEHLDILKQAVYVWNEWRKQRPELLPNLCHENLRQLHLEEANLSETNLEGANLQGTHLERANLIGAHLEGANLSDAYLERANLHLAFFSNATMLNRVVFGKKKQDGATFADVRWE